MFDTSHPFFRPLWRRIAIVAATAGWSMVEYANGAPLWSLFFLAISGWCIWAFFIRYDPDGSTKHDGDGSD